MLLRTRVSLIVFALCLVFAAGLTVVAVQAVRQERQWYSQDVLATQSALWGKMVDHAARRLDADSQGLVPLAALADAVQRRDSSAIVAAVGPLVDALRSRGRTPLVRVVGPDGVSLYNTRPVSDAAADMGWLRTAVLDARQPIRGVMPDSDGGFEVVLATVLTGRDGPVGALVMGGDLQIPLDEFRAAIGADVFLLDPMGHMVIGTAADLWKPLVGKLATRHSRIEMQTIRDRDYAVVILPLHDGLGRVAGGLVTLQDVTETQAPRKAVLVLLVGAAVGFAALALWGLVLYLRRSLRPLDDAVAVLRGVVGAGNGAAVPQGDEVARVIQMADRVQDHMDALDQQNQQRDRMRRRHELSILTQIRTLAATLDDQARTTLLGELGRIESAADQSGKSDDGLATLGAIFRAVSTCLRGQHDALTHLIEERAKDMDILREALHTRDHVSQARRELDFIRDLQVSSLPCTFPAFPDRTEFDLHAATVPAKEVGGDFYDFFLIDDTRLGLVLGDVSGRGMDTALFSTVTRSLIKAVAPLSSGPGECLAFVNSMLAADNPHTLFATCFHGVLDLTTGRMAFCNAGHPPPLILRDGKAVQAVRDLSGVSLGVTKDMQYGTGSLQMQPGDTLLLYSDGAIDAQDSQGARYGEQHLIDVFAAMGGQNTAQMVTGLISGIEGFQGDARQHDDITMLAMRFDRLAPARQADVLKQARPGLAALQPPLAQPIKVVVNNPNPQPQPVSEETLKAAPKPLVLKLKPVAKPAPAEGGAVVQPLSQALQPPQSQALPQAAAVPLNISLTPGPVVPSGKTASITIDNKLDELTRLAGWVDGFVKGNGLEDRISFNLNLCLDELITNIVSYGYQDHEVHQIGVFLSLQDGALMCRIEDDAVAHDPFVDAVAVGPDGAADERRTGGLGIFLVKEFMDRTDYRHRDGRNIVTLWKQV